MATGADIWVIGPNVTRLNRFVAWAGGYRYVVVSSVHDMVPKVLGLLGHGESIRTLWISGHGDVEFLGTNVHQAWMEVGTERVYAGTAPGYASVVEPIRDRMARGARIYLDGCKVGWSRELLLAFSRLFGGVPVTGGTMDQNVLQPGIEGTVVTCTAGPQGDTCRIERKWRLIDAIISPIDTVRYNP